MQNVEPIVSMIVANINSFVGESDLADKISKLPETKKKLVILNNSFLFRDKTKTIKSEKYLCFTAKTEPVTVTDCFVIMGPQLKSDYQFWDSDDDRIKGRTPLSAAVEKELSQLGKLVFVLIGKVDENVTVEVSIDQPPFVRIVLNPAITNDAAIGSDAILVKSLDDEERTWQLIESELEENGTDSEDVAKLKTQLGKAFSELREKAYAKLVIPEKLELGTPYFLDIVSNAIKESHLEYQRVLGDIGKGGADRKTALMEVYRIAYNFLDDALTLVRLIVSVCDLKPLILWATFVSHYRLTELVRSLPWVKQETKPSISTYSETIKKARNKAFHKLLPFSRSFEVALPDRSLMEARLRFFAEHKGKNPNALDFKDKELVEVLMEFTRTSEELVSVEFWQKNSSVIEGTFKVVDETSKLLKLCL
jgi:hypothetical protein